MSSQIQLYEGYRCDEDDSSAFFPSSHTPEQKAAITGPNAVLVFTCEASSWEEAMQKWYDFNGWGLYRGPEDTKELGCGEG